MSNHQAAQAVRLIEALQDQLAKMTAQLAWIERQDVTVRNARAYAMRVEAAALRRDIQEAQFLRRSRDFARRRWPFGQFHLARAGGFVG
jgi:capsule polysaccharide export protein KpsE/RkpR